MKTNIMGDAVSAPRMPIGLWWEATRPRMFPVWLSAGIIPGTVAFVDGTFEPVTFVLETLLCYLLLTLSCWADEYGDYEKGVDNERRLGPIRPVQRGAIPMATMLKGCYMLATASFLTGAVLVFWSCLRMPTPVWAFFAFAAAGAFCIICAFLYTMGSRPYGYHGWGDIAAYFFFGPVAGLGGFWFYAHSLDWTVLLPASAAGILLVVTINLQNMRDFDNDKANGKNTTAVVLGHRNAIVYHYLLVAGAIICYILFPALRGMANPLNYICVLGTAPLIKHCIDFHSIIHSDKNPKKLDTLMWPLTKSMLAIALMFCVGILF